MANHNRKYHFRHLVVHYQLHCHWISQHHCFRSCPRGDDRKIHEYVWRHFRKRFIQTDRRPYTLLLHSHRHRVLSVPIRHREICQTAKTDADKAAVNRIKKAYIFLIVGVVIGFVPTFGCFIKLICILASYIMLLFGYDALRKSSAQASEAQKGAAKLRSATIIMLIGSIMGCVPLFGSIIDGVLTFIAFFMVLSGWDAIKHGVPNLSEEEAEAALLHEEEKHPTPRMPKPEIQGYLLLALMAIQMIFSVWNNISTIPEYLYIPISNSVLLIVYLCYKKANLKGKFLVAICIALLTQIYAVIIPSIFSIESLECIYAIMIGNMFYILSLLVFVLPSRMNMGLKAAFIFMSSGALISFEFSFASWCVDTLQDAGLATGAIYAGFQIAHFLIIAFFVWRNHKQFTANSATPLSANTDRNSEA